MRGASSPTGRSKWLKRCMRNADHRKTALNGPGFDRRWWASTGASRASFLSASAVVTVALCEGRSSISSDRRQRTIIQQDRCNGGWSEPVVVGGYTAETSPCHSMPHTPSGLSNLHCITVRVCLVALHYKGIIRGMSRSRRRPFEIFVYHAPCLCRTDNKGSAKDVTKCPQNVTKSVGVVNVKGGANQARGATGREKYDI